MKHARNEEQPLGYLLHRVTTALRADVTENVLEPSCLTFAQYLCLRILTRFPGHSNADLARASGVSPQAMNTVVRELQKRGLVTRPKSVTSGRSLPVQLTREGHALLEQIDIGMRAAEDRLLADLADTRRRDLIEILADLA
jgi:DNA-binding MarR family transcriptional regulator